jgi:protein TonB
MFEWSLIESTTLKPKVETNWYFLGTMVVYSLITLVAIVASILLVNPELKQTMFFSSLVAPEPPPAPGPGIAKRTPPTRNVIQVPVEFVVPQQIPTGPPPILPIVPVSLSGTARDSIGVIGGIEGGIGTRIAAVGLGGLATPVEVPEPPRSNVSPEKKDPPRRVSQGVLVGNAIRKVTPIYPPMARSTRIHGTVQVEVIIDEDGSVISAQVVDGHALLRQAAADAALQWKFRPTLLSGQPIKVTGILIFKFTL